MILDLDNASLRAHSLTRSSTQIPCGKVLARGHHPSPGADQQGDVPQLHFGEGAGSTEELLNRRTGTGGKIIMHTDQTNGTFPSPSDASRLRLARLRVIRYPATGQKE